MPEPSATTSHQPRILLAEDDPVNRRVTYLLMERLGYQLDTVTNGAEAVNAVRREKYNVVLMDVEMPIMDGIEATRCIHADFLGIPERPYIVALTASADETACRAGGMDSYLRKPVGLNDLAKVLAQNLPKVTRPWEVPA